MTLQHLRSSTANKRPLPGSMSDGQLAINTNTSSPGLFFKDSAGALVKVGPVHVGSTAPNVSPASGGETGNTVGEQWLDTSGSTYVFKIWDGSAWRSEAGEFVNTTGDTMTGALGIITGSASTPGLFFSGDANSGLYSPGADQVAISTNGTGRLFVDANGNVGVGLTPSTWSVGRALQVGSTANALFGATSSQLNLMQNATYDGDFKYANTAAASYYQQLAGAHIWYTAASGTAGTTATFSERLRITNDGRLGLGTSGPGSFDPNGDDLVVGGGSASHGMTFYSSTTGNGSIYFADGTSGTDLEVGSILYRHASNSLAFTTAAAERLRIDSSGRVGIGTNSATELLSVNGNLWLGNGGGSGGAEMLRIWNDGGVERIHASNNPSALAFGIGGSAGTNEAFRVDTNKRLLVGTSSARSTAVYGTPSIQALGDYQQGSIHLTNNSNSNANCGIAFSKIRGSSIVQNGDYLGGLTFNGFDGSADKSGATIEAVVDGTPGANDMPGRLVFATTADGASSPTERARITSKGYFKASYNGSYYAVGDSYHEFLSGLSDELALHIENTATTNPYGVRIRFSGASPNDATRYFLTCVDSGTTTRAEIRSNGGLANYSANNVNLSDINAKKDIAPAAGTWDCLKEWEIVNFRYKDQPDDADLNMGVIAQQVAESCPEVITVFQEAKEANETEPAQEERLGVKDQQMMWMAIKALQEAQLRIEALEAEVAALKGA